MNDRYIRQAIAFFPDVVLKWEWEDACKLLNSAKILTKSQVYCFAGLLSNYTDVEIGNKLDIRRESVRTHLSDGPYQAFKNLNNLNPDSKTGKKDLINFLKERGFRKSLTSWDNLISFAQRRNSLTISKINDSMERNIVIRMDEDTNVVSEFKQGDYIYIEIKPSNILNYLVVLYKGTSGDVFVLKPSFYAKQQLIQTNIITIPENRIKLFQLGHVGVETVVALETPTKLLEAPRFLNSNSFTKISQEHLDGLLKKMLSQDDWLAIYQTYRVVPS